MYNPADLTTLEDSPVITTLRPAIVAAAGLLLAVAAEASPLTSPCVSVSLSALSSYQCSLGGMTFDFSHPATNTNPTGLQTEAIGSSSFTAPTDFAVDFVDLGGGVAVNYRPIGGTQFATSAASDPSVISYSEASASFNYAITLDASTTLFGVYGAFGPSYAAITGPSAIGQSQGSFFLNYGQGGGCVATAVGYNLQNSLTGGQTGQFSASGISQAPQSLNPFITGNELYGTCVSNQAMPFWTQSGASALVLPTPLGSSSANGSIAAGWSTIFMTTPKAPDLTPVPETSSGAMVGCGVVLLVGAVVRRRSALTDS